MSAGISSLLRESLWLTTAATTAIGAGLVGFGSNTASASNPVPVASIAVDSATDCPKYFIYVLRGSDEPPPLTLPVPQAGDPTDLQGMGRTGKTFTEAFKLAVKPDSVEVQPSAYPAAPVPAPYDALGFKRYVDSLTEGQRLLESDLDKFRARCDASRSRIIIVGYSQGAQVVHGRIIDGSNAIQKALDRNGVTDIVLFGDPMFCPTTDRAKNAGKDGGRTFSGDYNPAARGVALCAVPLEAKPGRTIWSYCHELDKVCQGGGTIDAVPQPAWLDGHHQSYPDLDADAAGWRVGIRYRSSTGPSTFNAPASYFLCEPGIATARVFARAADHIRIVAESDVSGTTNSEILREIPGPQNDGLFTVTIPAGADRISAYSSYRDPVSYRRLATFSVAGQGCSPGKAAVKSKRGPPGESAKQQSKQRKSVTRSKAGVAPPKEVPPPKQAPRQNTEPKEPVEQQPPDSPNESSCPNGMVRVGPETDTSSGCAPAGNSNEPEEEDSPTQPDEGEYRDQVCPPECPDGQDESGSTGGL